ncbi:MAG: hypothetical protein M3313_16485 [Actinomycetota bacterium]|nr:hypothetical protein [Actinomycetota bacterium]
MAEPRASPARANLTTCIAVVDRDPTGVNPAPLVRQRQMVGERDVTPERPRRRGTMQTVESVSTVIAPLTVVTALLLYVGWVRTRAFFSYFGVSPALVGYSPQDYVLFSAEVSFGAVLLLAFAGVVLLGLDRLVTIVIERVSGRLMGGQWVRWGLAGLGASLVLIGLGGATTEAAIAVVPPIAGAGLLALGAVLFLRFGAESPSQQGILRPGTTVLSVVVLVLACFWAATIYARALGVGAAVAIDGDVRRLPVATVYSGEPLDLPGTNVTATRVLGEDQRWNYRYTGAGVLTYSNERWFLIPEPASGGYRSSVVVLRDSESIRVETAMPN